ncbi:nucleotidyltransferase family protein [Pseudomonas syringae]|uniref:Molybdopterin-guanine dinucleotide biosynthesis protein MobA n=1 Tax=Pseudomonas syringae TaxID=317 RepID=A0A085VJZ2_PSESX|nr:nucleotidyltransferase family protein [Pseudomonas syringae]KFE55755.1 molybdopterin-guanine dinucleotide biosynthesis protein MobA [Pseudomonas syringae]
MTESTCAIVLAAGHGSRFQAIAGQGRSKLLARCVGRDGIDMPVVEHTLINLQGVVDRVLVVTRPDASEIITLAHQYGCGLLMLESPGMGDSIAAAVAAEPHHRAWLIVLGDMPFILPETFQRLVAAQSDELIIVPVHQTERGQPVGFGRKYGPALMALTGDQGAKRLFQDGNVQSVDVADPGVLWDVDVPEGLVFSLSRSTLR